MEARWISSVNAVLWKSKILLSLSEGRGGQRSYEQIGKGWFGSIGRFRDVVQDRKSLSLFLSVSKANELDAE